MQDIGVDARLKGVLLLQLLGRLERAPTGLVVDQQSTTGTGGIGAQQVDGTLGIGPEALHKPIHAEGVERHLGTTARPGKGLGAHAAGKPARNRLIETLALGGRAAPVAA